MAIDWLSQLPFDDEGRSTFIRHDVEWITEACSDPSAAREFASQHEGKIKDDWLRLSELPEEQLREEMQRLRGMLMLLADAASLPYPEFVALTEQPPGEVPVFSETGKNRWDLYRGLVATMHRGEVTVSAYQVLAGLKMYELQTGAFPEALEELVPGYLPAMPKDPFSGDLFKYAITSEGATIYSVGPDMKDDFAKEITTGAMRGGDIVFEIR
jgi:hypothetical protein